MARKFFKKQSLTDTLVNVGIGGAANVVADFLMNTITETIQGDSKSDEQVMTPNTKNIIKVVGGAVIGGMVSDRYLRAAADGIATVGVSNLISDLMTPVPDSKNDGDSVTGLPNGTIGSSNRIPHYGRRKGVGDVTTGFMEK